MKKISFFCSILICLFLSSCGEMAKQPELHDDEIKDAVRYQIAFWQSVANQANNSWFLDYDDVLDQYSELEDKILPKYNYTYQNEINSYRCAVQDVAYSDYKYSNYAQDILDRYDRLSVALSDYQEIVSGQRWIFHETQTGISFSYTVSEIGGSHKYTWIVDYDEDSMSDYIDSLLN